MKTLWVSLFLLFLGLTFLPTAQALAEPTLDCSVILSPDGVHYSDFSGAFGGILAAGNLIFGIQMEELSGAGNDARTISIGQDCLTNWQSDCEASSPSESCRVGHIGVDNSGNYGKVTGAATDAGDISGNYVSSTFGMFRYDGLGLIPDAVTQDFFALSPALTPNEVYDMKGRIEGTSLHYYVANGVDGRIVRVNETAVKYNAARSGINNLALPTDTTLIYGTLKDSPSTNAWVKITASTGATTNTVFGDSSCSNLCWVPMLPSQVDAGVSVYGARNAGAGATFVPAYTKITVSTWNQVITENAFPVLNGQNANGIVWDIDGEDAFLICGVEQGSVPYSAWIVRAETATDTYDWSLVDIQEGDNGAQADFPFLCLFDGDGGFFYVSNIREDSVNRVNVRHYSGGFVTPADVLPYEPDFFPPFEGSSTTGTNTNPFGLDFDRIGEDLGLSAEAIRWFFALLLIAVIAYAFTAIATGVTALFLGAFGVLIGIGISVVFDLLPMWFLLVTIFLIIFAAGKTLYGGGGAED